MLLNKDRSTCPPWASHIEKLKDVVELDLTINPAYEAKRKDAVGDGMYQDKLVSRYQCPVTGLEMNGRFKFVFSWTTGKVVSERAMKVLRNDPDEAEKFKEEDSVVLNPNEEVTEEPLVKKKKTDDDIKAFKDQ